MLPKRILAGVTVAAAASLVLAVTVSGNSSYSITVQLDETTQGDIDVVGASVESTAPGAEVQRSLRRLATSAAGELSILADQRIDSNGVLTLDSGLTVALAADDEVTVSAVGEPEVEYVNASGARIRAPRKRVVIIPQCQTGSCPMKPYAILITTNSGCRRLLLFSHPPVIGSC